MNAGAYGIELKDILVSAKVITRNGEKITLTPSEFGFAYRHSDINDVF